jgi:hypothetical protein
MVSPDGAALWSPLAFEIPALDADALRHMPDALN